MTAISSHAFAQGRSYEIRRGTAEQVMRVIAPVLRVLANWIDAARSVLVASTFRRGAVMGPGCRVGSNAWCHNVHERDRVRVGDHMICRGIVRCEDWGDPRIIIGDHVYIGDNALISAAERVEIGRFSLVAHGVQIFDNDSHPVDPFMRERDYLIVCGHQQGPRHGIATAAVFIGEQVWIGCNSIILKGVTIGARSIISAGSVVTSCIPADSIAAGNPARVVKTLSCREYLELPVVSEPSAMRTDAETRCHESW